MEANTQTWLIALTLTNIAIILFVRIWYSFLKSDFDLIKGRTKEIWSIQLDVINLKRKFKKIEEQEELENYYQARKEQEEFTIRFAGKKNKQE